MLVESNSNSIRNKIRTLTSDSVFRNGLFKRLLWTKTRLNAQYVPTLVFVNDDIMLLGRANDERKELTFSADDCKALKTMFMYSPASSKPLPVPINSFAYWIDPQTKRQRRPANRYHVNSTGVLPGPYPSYAKHKYRFQMRPCIAQSIASCLRCPERCTQYTNCEPKTSIFVVTMAEIENELVLTRNDSHAR